MNCKINIKPLSINKCFRGRKIRTIEYDIFIKNMLFLLPNTIEIPNKEHIKLAVEFGFSSKASDIDNCLKSFIDCLVKKYKVDDRFIYELHTFKTIVKKGDEFIRFKIY